MGISLCPHARVVSLACVVLALAGSVEAQTERSSARNRALVDAAAEILAELSGRGNVDAAHERRPTADSDTERLWQLRHATG